MRDRQQETVALDPAQPPHQRDEMKRQNVEDTEQEHLPPELVRVL